MNRQHYLKLIDDVIASGYFKDDWASLCIHPEPLWYRQAKFGIFIHWGVFSVPAFANEWYPRHMYRKGSVENTHHLETYGDLKNFGYKDFIPMFRVEKFDADTWLNLFKQAGARYIMPVAEHHDGFQMYKSDLSRWNAVEMGPCRDILSELKQAAEKRDLVFCLSSHRAEHYWFMNGGRELDCDVNDPQYEDFYGPAILTDGLKAAVPERLYDTDINSPGMKKHLDDWLARTCELVDNYQPKVIYFDWWIQNQAFKSYLKKLAAYYYNRALEWDFEVTINYKLNAFALTSAIHEIERGQLKNISPRFWQNDTSIAKNSWCYTEGNDFKKSSDIIENMIDVVSKNGCLLLNVGPKADGTICTEEVRVLREIGTWLDKNGEGIYGTTFWKVFGEGPTEIPEGQFSDTKRKPFTSQDIRYTYKNSRLYVFVMKVPEDGIIHMTELRYKDLPEENEVFLNPILLGFENVPLEFRRNGREMTVWLKAKIESLYPLCVRFDIL